LTANKRGAAMAKDEATRIARQLAGELNSIAPGNEVSAEIQRRVDEAIKLEESMDAELAGTEDGFGNSLAEREEPKNMAKTMQTKTWTKEDRAKGILARISEDGYAQSQTGMVKIERARDDDTTDANEKADFLWKAGERVASYITFETAVKRLVGYKKDWLDGVTVFGSIDAVAREREERNQRKAARISTRGLPELKLEDPSEWEIGLDVPTEKSVKKANRRVASGNKAKANSGRSKSNGKAKAKAEVVLPEGFAMVSAADIAIGDAVYNLGGKGSPEGDHTEFVVSIVVKDDGYNKLGLIPEDDGDAKPRYKFCSRKKSFPTRKAS
jgi:hypothetical protein